MTSSMNRNTVEEEWVYHRGGISAWTGRGVSEEMTFKQGLEWTTGGGM